MTSLRPRLAGGQILTATALAAVFLLDLMMPVGYTVPRLYVLPIILTWLLPGRQSTVFITGSVLLLTWLGHGWELLGGVFSWGEFNAQAVTNHATVSVLLLVVGGLVIGQKHLAQEASAADEARRESEQRMLAIMEGTSDAVFIKDLKGRYLLFNRAAGQFFGKSPGEVLGQDDTFLLPADEAKAVMEKDRNVMANGKTVTYEDRVITADGVCRTFSSTKGALLDAQGVACGLFGISRDITERNRVQEELQRTHAFLDSIVENIPDMIFVKDARDLRFVRFNKAGEELLGHRRQDLIGRNDYDFFPKEEADFFTVKDRAVLESRKLLDIPEEPIDTKHRGMRVLHTKKIPLLDEEGRPQYLLGISEDITERKQVEEVLRSSEELLRGVINSLSAHVAVLNAEGTIIAVNRAWERFASANDAHNLSAVWVGANYLEECRRAAGRNGQVRDIVVALEEIMTGHRASFQIEYPCHSATEQRWFMLRATPLATGTGGLVVAHENITERKRVEEELRRLNSELEDRVARRTAELRDLSVKLLQVQEEERRRIARELHDDFSQRLAALTLELRNVCADVSAPGAVLSSRLNRLGDMAERLATELQQVAHRLHPSILEHAGLEAAVREHVEEFATRTGLTAEVIVRNVPKTVPPDQATCLFRVLQESLQNVKKHANASSVLIRLLRTDRGLGLCVHDDGRGFEDSQGVSSRKALGLTSMSERVGVLKGTFRVQTKPGVGTEVHAWVPLEEAKE
jgi:PAS domain S-box-containing protein